jgi:hypothetical protein
MNIEALRKVFPEVARLVSTYQLFFISVVMRRTLLRGIYT